MGREAPNSVSQQLLRKLCSSSGGSIKLISRWSSGGANGKTIQERQPRRFISNKIGDEQPGHLPMSRMRQLQRFQPFAGPMAALSARSPLFFRKRSLDDFQRRREVTPSYRVTLFMPESFGMGQSAGGAIIIRTGVLKADQEAYDRFGEMRCGNCAQRMHYVLSPLTIDVREHAEVGIWCSMPDRLPPSRSAVCPPRIHVHVREKTGGTRVLIPIFEQFRYCIVTNLIYSNAEITRVNVTPPSAFEFVCGL